MTNELQQVTLGDADADLVVTGGEVILPESGQRYERDIVVAGERIAGLPADGSAAIGPETETVDASGCVVTPGLVNAHVHIDSFQPFERIYHRILETGTTALVTECCDFGCAFGADGLDQLLGATADIPFRVYPTVPPQAFLDAFDLAYEQFDDAARAAHIDALDNPRVIGVGEIPWVQVVGRSSPVEKLVDAAHDRGKTVSAHGAGCTGERLVALASMVDDDHESVSSRDVIERIENGLHAVGRYSTFRDDIEAVLEAYERFGPSELSLSTDWIWPTDIVDEGYMDAVLRRAIQVGIEPIDAVRMATLNPARHFGLDGIGSLSPGSLADIAVFEDLQSLQARTVIVDGEVVVEEGTALVEPREYEYPDWFRESVSVSPTVEDFRVPVSAGQDGRIRAVHLKGGTVTSETTVEPAVSGDSFVPDPDRDVLAVSLFDRFPDSAGTGFTGFLTGYGLEAGAVATTHTWQTSGLLAIGTDAASMHRATKEVVEQGGGWVVRDDSATRVSFPTPIGARCGECTLDESATKLRAVSETLRELGVTAELPPLLPQALTFTGVPALRLSFSGYADVFAGETVGLNPEK